MATHTQAPRPQCKATQLMHPPDQSCNRRNERCTLRASHALRPSGGRGGTVATHPLALFPFALSLFEFVDVSRHRARP